MKLPARLALSQLKVNKRRTTWTVLGIILSTGMIMTVYGLGYGSGMDMLDRLIGDNPFRDTYNATIRGIANVMSIIILSISVVVISNAFRVSASERMSQFGILKSTGATKRQIMTTVIYEGIFLTIIAIPIGIALGLLMQFIGVQLIDHTFYPSFINDPDFDYDYFIKFVFSTVAIAMSIIVSVTTVLISVYLPARKASLVPAIDAIKGTGEVTVKNKKVYASGLMQKIFKIEGMLAHKFLKRSKRNFRASVIAMSFSIIIFIVAGGLIGQMNSFTNMMWGDEGFNVRLRVYMERSIEVPCEEWDSGDGWKQNEHYNENGIFFPARCWQNVDLTNAGIPHTEIAVISQELREVLAENDAFLGTGHHSEYGIDLHESNITPEVLDIIEDWRWDQDEGYHRFWVSLISVDEENYQLLSELAGVPLGSNILINTGRYTFPDTGRRVELQQLEFDYQTFMLFDEDTDEAIELALHGQLTAEQVPSTLISHSVNGLIVIVPPSEKVLEYTWLIDAEDSASVTAEARTLLAELMNERHGRFSAFDANAAEAEERNTVRLVTALTYAFVGTLILIGMTNVISTISENINSRSKEFAILQSVGLTSGGIKRMLNLESIFSSLKSLLIGVPIGILGTYLTHDSLDTTAQFDYRVPWLSILISIIAVFLITWLTMRHATQKLRKQNIIETIRSGSGS